MSPSPRPNLSLINDRVDDHESRIDALETRLAKYDIILERLNVLIDVLTKNVEKVDEKARGAIEGQKILQERNEGVNRWATIGISIASSSIVGTLAFVLGYIVHH